MASLIRDTSCPGRICHKMINLTPLFGYTSIRASSEKFDLRIDSMLTESTVLVANLAMSAPLVWDAYSLYFRMLDITVNYDGGSSKDSEFEHLTWIDDDVLTGTARTIESRSMTPSAMKCTIVYCSL
ncbi:uncharacterized protein Bfra_000353 [Botrytis fragariae]|uniref:Uncharacterized protein n=1 Tax=Botrytis fragariae TaxID=1964551 RepID=A0A8H6B2Y5_9HELO|nr:uncharacterized protein Bfra_000353 [Botrytis fragariae]KAF5878188.1 hypothetical protein Bfra_000353 [Botrytis fragariae]